MLIDFHVHVFPDFLAEKALSGIYSATKNPPTTDGTLRDTLDKMDAWKVDKAVLMHIATKPTQHTAVNTWAQQIQQEYPDRFACYGSVHPDAPNAVEEIARIRELGLHGLKLHPDYQQFFPDDPKIFPLYDAMDRLKLPVVFHMGYNILDPKNTYATPQRIWKVAQQFPKLRIIAAHMGGVQLWKEAEEILAGKPVYLDTSLSSRFCPADQFSRILQKHGEDYLLFGSDCPWSSAAEERSFLEQFPLSDTKLGKILYRNAQYLLEYPFSPSV